LDYFVLHVGNGPLSFAFDFGVYCLLFNFFATVVDTFAQGHYKDSARQAGFAATKAEAAKCKKYHIIMTSKAITTFNQWQ